jgi:hypothetical protein
MAPGTAAGTTDGDAGDVGRAAALAGARLPRQAASGATRVRLRRVCGREMRPIPRAWARSAVAAAVSGVGAATSDRVGLPRYPHHPSGVPCPLPRRIGRVRASIASPSVRPSPFCRRVGIRISTFEACSGFTRVTARRIAQPPKAAFVTRLRSGRLPDQTARQLPELSTIPWMDPSSTGDTRPRGALQISRLTRV